MILMGDEYGHTRHGNNNTWCQDDERNYFLWNMLETDQDFFRFHTLTTAFRKSNPLLQRTEFLTDNDVIWHGLIPSHANWGNDSRFLAYTLIDHEKMEHIYIAFNAHFNGVHIQLPPPPDKKNWYRIIDTALDSPNDFIEDPKKSPPLKYTYNMEAHSAFVARAF